MSSIPFEKELKAAKQAAIAAGEILKSNYRNIARIDVKHDQSLVTNADKESDEKIQEILLRAFPESELVTEESGVVNASENPERRWCIDPLDGTTNFVHGLPFFCVCIGMEYQGELSLGVVYSPILGDLFTATRGGGAYCNQEPIRVSQTTEFDKATLSFERLFSGVYKESLEHCYQDMKKARAVRSFGAGALNLAYLARGSFDILFGKQMKSWDTAAGQMLVLEAGGKVTKFDGSPHRPGDPDMLCSNGPLHEVAMKWFT